MDLHLSLDFMYTRKMHPGEIDRRRDDDRQQVWPVSLRLEKRHLARAVMSKAVVRRRVTTAFSICQAVRTSDEDVVEPSYLTNIDHGHFYT